MHCIYRALTWWNIFPHCRIVVSLKNYGHIIGHERWSKMWTCHFTAWLYAVGCDRDRSGLGRWLGKSCIHEESIIMLVHKFYVGLVIEIISGRHVSSRYTTWFFFLMYYSPNDYCLPFIPRTIPQPTVPGLRLQPISLTVRFWVWPPQDCFACLLVETNLPRLLFVSDFTFLERHGCGLGRAREHIVHRGLRVIRLPPPLLCVIIKLLDGFPDQTGYSKRPPAWKTLCPHPMAKENSFFFSWI